MASLKYGIDVKTQTDNRDEDPWKPVMKNAYVRQTYDTAEELLAAFDAMKAGNLRLELRAVHVASDDPTYSV